MRTLRIERGGKIVIDGSPVDINQVANKDEFISSLLTLDVELSDDMSVIDIVHFFYESRTLIKSVLSDEYESVRALVTSCTLPRDYKYLKVYKDFKIEKEISSEEEFIYLIPEIELVPANLGEEGIRNIGGLPIIISEEILLKHEDLQTEKVVYIKSKTKLSLFDLMRCVFDELPSLIKDGLILAK